MNGVVAIRGERVVAVGAAAAELPGFDLGNVAIVPGLVNAHAHLEFSHLAAPLGTSGMPFPDWIRRVVEHRRGGEFDRGSAIRRGLEASAEAGVTSLGEIATPPWPTDAYRSTSVGLVVFHELIGLASDRVEPQVAAAQAHLETESKGTFGRGLSPHAPYSVHPELFAKCIAEASKHDAPVAFHLAESPEELTLLKEGTGPFRDLLKDLGAWDASALKLCSKPLDYLKVLAKAPQAMVIHGNYLTDVEIEFLGDHAGALSVVYCPRTHAYFGHERHPLPKLLRAGASVALGTDSLASNPDLSLWREMAQVLATFPELSPATALELGTIDGARALGLLEFEGSLRVGGLANLAIVGLPEHDAADPHELLFESGAGVIARVFRGRPSFDLEPSPMNSEIELDPIP